jgi:phenylalanyl-tRNA synthetase beta chain
MHPRLAHALGLGDDIQLLELALEPALVRRLPRAHPVARFPSVRRDLAFDLPEEIRWSQVEQVVRAALGTQLATMLLFDRYSGKGVDPGRKSLAMGLILQDASRTLTDDDADRCVREAIAALEQTCKAKLRG